MTSPRRPGDDDHGSGDGRRRSRRRWRIRATVIVLLILAIPIPWKQTDAVFAPGTAWRLDGRLEVEGETVDPPGEWSWLAYGRPQLVGEALWSAVFGTDDAAKDLRRGLITRTPALAEPAAAAIGLRAAGHEVPLGLIVEVRDPVRQGYPQHALISTIDGVELTDRRAWREASLAWEEESGLPTSSDPSQVTFSLRDGRSFTAAGPGLPYQVVSVLDVAPVELEAGISFKMAQRLPVDWFRNLSLGSSHGMMVALTTYAEASGQDLAQGRHIAGTGGVRGDGTLARIGGLLAKARAAKRANADVLIFPVSQSAELEGHDFGSMTLVPVGTLGEAIDWLQRPVT